jgi:adenosylhomocysteine nucleosidase
MAILFVASEAFELEPLAQRLTGRRPLKWPVQYAEEGVWHGKRYLLAANGPGAGLATKCVEVALRATSAVDLSSSKLEGVVSVGLCGALQPSLNVGDILVGTEVLDANSGERFTCSRVTHEGMAAEGSVISIARIAVTKTEKAKLAETGAHAVEMEAAGIAKRTVAATLPFACIKVVSDRVDEEFVIDFNELRTTEGRFARGKIVVYALTHPSVISSLLQLRRRSKEASGALGAFLASCRFQFSETPSYPEESEQ